MRERQTAPVQAGARSWTPSSFPSFVETVRDVRGYPSVARHSPPPGTAIQWSQTGPTSSASALPPPPPSEQPSTRGKPGTHSVQERKAQEIKQEPYAWKKSSVEQQTERSKSGADEQEPSDDRYAERSRAKNKSPAADSGTGCLG